MARLSFNSLAIFVKAVDSRTTANSKINSALFAVSEDMSNFATNELFEGIALQNAEIRTVAKSLPLTFQNSANCLSLN